VGGFVVSVVLDGWMNGRKGKGGKEVIKVMF